MKEILEKLLGALKITVVFIVLTLLIILSILPEFLNLGIAKDISWVNSL